jgi:drug/metabolite transporter (DMT)-like permease
MREISAALLSVLLMAGTQLLFKQAIRLRKGKSSSSRMAGVLALLLHPLVLLGIASNLLSAGCWLVAMSRLDLSFLFPLLSLNYLLVPLGAAVCFNERISKRRKLGIALVCVGVVVSSLAGRA